MLLSCIRAPTLPAIAGIKDLASRDLSCYHPPSCRASVERKHVWRRDAKFNFTTRLAWRGGWAARPGMIVSIPVVPGETRMRRVVALACGILSGVLFYFSTDLGAVWPLAWIAAVPVLWLAFRSSDSRLAFAMSWLAGSLGGLNFLPPSVGGLPLAIVLRSSSLVSLMLGIVAQGLGLAICAMGARLVLTRVSAVAAAIAFAALWTAFDFAMAQGPHGTAFSPSYSQVGMPVLIQSASVFGLWIITFLLGIFAAGIAATLATGRLAPAIVAVILMLANLGYGGWRMVTAPESPTVRVGLAADDALIGAGLKNARKASLHVIDAYAGAISRFGAQGAKLVVLPEKIAVVSPQWKGIVDARLGAEAHAAHETIVVGLDSYGREHRNVARVFPADGTAPIAYAKRHLIGGLEDSFVPGRRPLVLSDGIGIAICKDMDFQNTLRADTVVRPSLYAVPAWDFGGDAWWHARVAFMRGVEHGFSVARAADQGFMTLSDAYGRVLRKKHSGIDGMATLLGDLPRGPGHTIYGLIGDTFAWLCIGASIGLVGAALARRRP